MNTPETLQTISTEAKSWLDLIYILITSVISGGLAFLLARGRSNNTIREMQHQAKIESENRKAEKEAVDEEHKKRIEALTAEIRGIGVKIGQLIESNDARDKKDNFKESLINMFNRVTSTVVYYHPELTPGIKNIFMRASHELKRIAIDFYKYDLRGNEHEMVKFIDPAISSYISIIENELLHLDEPVRAFTYTSGKISPISLLAFLRGAPLGKEPESHWYQLIYKLQSRLEINGLDYDETIAVFAEFLDTYFMELLKMLEIWKDLKIYKVEDHLPKDIFDEEERKELSRIESKM